MDFSHNRNNNSLKYAANITPVTGSTKSDVFLKDVFSKFEAISK